MCRSFSEKSRGKLSPLISYQLLTISKYAIQDMNIITMQGLLCTNCIRIHWIMYTEFAFIVLLSILTSNDLSMTFDYKFLKKTLNLSHSIITSFKLHQHPLNYKKVTPWLYFNNDPNWPLNDFWPNFMNTPTVPSSKHHFIQVTSIFTQSYAYNLHL